jgi:hypothetical protein
MNVAAGIWWSRASPLPQSWFRKSDTIRPPKSPRRPTLPYRTIKEIAREEGILPEDKLDSLLDTRRITNGGILK